jgi:hypothetical protein
MHSVPIIRRKSAQFPVALSRSYAEDLASIRSPGSHDDRCTWLQSSGLSSAVKNVVCFDEHLMSFAESYDSFHGMRAGKVNTSLPPFFLTGGQIRAARSLIRWTAENLAAASALSVATICRAELKENQTALTIRIISRAAGVFADDVAGIGIDVRRRRRCENSLTDL